MWVTSWMTRGCGLVTSCVALCGQRQNIMMQRNNRPPLKKKKKSHNHLSGQNPFINWIYPIKICNFKSALHSKALLKTHTHLCVHDVCIWLVLKIDRPQNHWACSKVKMNSNTKSHDQSSQTAFLKHITVFHKHFKETQTKRADFSRLVWMSRMTRDDLLPNPGHFCIGG